MGQSRAPKTLPEHECPDCGQLCHTSKHLDLHKLSKHPDTYKEGVGIRQPAGIPIRYKLSGNAPVPQKNQAKSWKTCNSNFCPACARKFPTIALCRKHWSGTCSNPLVKKCPGCQLLIKTAAAASWKLGGKYRKFSFIPERIRKQAWPLHNCLKDPEKAPDIARRGNTS